MHQAIQRANIDKQQKIRFTVGCKKRACHTNMKINMESKKEKKKEKEKRKLHEKATIKALQTLKPRAGIVPGSC